MLRAKKQIFDVPDYAQLITHRFAIFVADAFGLINVDAQKAISANFPFNVHDFQAQRMRHALCGFADALQFHFGPSDYPPESVRLGSNSSAPGAPGSRPTKKWARAH